LLPADADELMLQQKQHTSTVIFNPDSHSEGDSKNVDAPKIDVESDPLLHLRATPLSNQERLMLRKQALKMKKRPVLSIGIFLDLIQTIVCTNFKPLC
jgi:hypothetical protein